MASGYANAAGAQGGMKFYQQQFQQGWTPNVAASGAFEASKAATLVGGGTQVTWYYTKTGPLPQLQFDWGVSPLPHGSIFFDHNFSDTPIVWAQTANPNEAVALLAYLNNDQNRLAYQKNWGPMPSRQSLIDQLPDYLNWPQSLVVSATNGGYGAPVTPGWNEYFNAINIAVKDIALGADVQPRLDTVAKQIDGLLAKY
jgi:multiple sugar transport system substrate-binding protein